MASRLPWTRETIDRRTEVAGVDGTFAPHRRKPQPGRGPLRGRPSAGPISGVMLGRRTRASRARRAPELASARSSVSRGDRRSPLRAPRRAARGSIGSPIANTCLAATIADRRGQARGRPTAEGVGAQLVEPQAPEQ